MAAPSRVCLSTKDFRPQMPTRLPRCREPVLQPLAPGQVIRIGPTAGTGTPTRDYGIGATDLCVFMEFPTEVVQVCGDSFAGQASASAATTRRSRCGSTVVGRQPGRRPYTGVTGITSPLLAEPTPVGDSQLPAGVVQINRQNYSLVTTTKDLAPQSSRISNRTVTRSLADDSGVGAVATYTGCEAIADQRLLRPDTNDRSCRPAGSTSSPTTSIAANRRCCTGSRLQGTSATDPAGRAGRPVPTAVGTKSQPRCGVT